MKLNSNEGYCVKCKDKRNIINWKVVRMKNKMEAISGYCSYCGTKIYKILGKQ